MTAIPETRRQNRRALLAGVLSVTTALLCWSSARAQSSASHDIPRQTIDGGAARSSSTSYTLNATIGQPDAGPRLSSTSYSLRGGFQRATPAGPMSGPIFSDGFESP